MASTEETSGHLLASEEESIPLATTRRNRTQRGKSWNVLAVLAFVAALVASPLAVLFGYLAVGQIRRSDQRGETLAWIAVGLGWLWLAILLVITIALGIIWSETPLWP